MSDSKEKVSLHDSAENGSVKGVQEALSLGADINYTDVSLYGKTPLYLASQHGHSKVVILLLQHHADPNISEEIGMTPLCAASLWGHTEIVILLLQHRADPNISDENGMTPLHVARNKDIAEFLVKYGANINVLSKPAGNTVLHAACRVGRDTALIDYLILKGLSIESCNEYGETPLHLVCDERTAKHLIDQYGADINVLTKDGNTVLHTVCSNYTNDDSILDYLIKTKGLKLDATNKYGETPLHLAYDERTIEHLVDQYGADINVLTDDGNTILHVVSKYGNVGILDYLIDFKGLKLDALNKFSQTPIDILKLHSDDERVSRGRRRCLQWLQNEGLYKVSDDYIPLWKEAAEEGTVDTIWTNVSIGGASGVGKTSFACLVLDQPPPIHHHSTDVIQPLPVYTVADTPHNGNKATNDNADDDKLDDDGIGHTTTDTTSNKEGPARVHDTSKPQTTASSNQNEADGVKSHIVLSDGQSCHQWKMAEKKELYKKLAKCALAHKLKKSKAAPEMPRGRKKPATSHPNSTASTRPVSPAVPNTSEPVNQLPKDALSKKEQIQHIEELQSSREILEMIAELETCDKLDETHFVHLLDTGGQASLIDIAPALVRFNSVNILILKLDEPLTDTVNFFYSVKGEVKGREYRNMTNEELLASLIAARRNIKRPEVPGLKEDDLVKPKLIIIGTHYDRYKEMEKNKELKETIREKEEQLLKLLSLEEADCYYYDPEKSQFIFPMNTMSREPAELNIASQIRQIACQTYLQAPIPLRWYLVQLELNEMKAENKDIVRVKEIVDFGFNMDEKAVRASLKYFHVLTICLYFPQVLPDIVFLSPDYLAKQIGRIAAVAMCQSERAKLTKNEISRLIDEGIFEVSLLGKIGMEFSYESFAIDDFMMLLEHLFIIIRTTDKRCSYFMPSLLSISHENILDTLLQSSDYEVDPVSLKWESAMPSGMLSSVSMAMCQSTVTPIKKPPRKLQYRNKITLHCRELECSLVLFEYAKCLGLAHTGSAKDSPIVLKAATEGIKSVVNKFHWVEGVSQPSVGFLIPSSSPDGDGTIYHYYQRSNKNHDRLVCEELEYKSIKINKQRQLPWFQKVSNDDHTDVPLSKRPTYSEESNHTTANTGATAMMTDPIHPKSHSTTEHNQGQCNGRYRDGDMPLSDPCKQLTSDSLRHCKSSTQQSQLHSELEEQDEVSDADGIPPQKRPKFEPSTQGLPRNVSESSTCALGIQSQSLQFMQTQGGELLESRKRRNNEAHSGCNPKHPSTIEPPITSPSNQQVVDKYEVFDLLSDKSAQWQKIGRTMKVEHNYRDSLQKDGHLDDDDRLERVICKWVESTTPSWDQFIAILKKLRYNDVITSIQGQ